MGKSIVTVGIQWGDEGKGKIVDLLNADVTVRFQGGNNAGHTLKLGGIKYILQLIPSGILHENSQNYIGNGVVVNPTHLVNEISMLEKKGVPVKERLKVSYKAPLILSSDIELDKALEKLKLLKGNKIGTTLNGIGPAYEDVAGRRSLRFSDLEKTPEALEGMLKETLSHHRYVLEGVYGDLQELMNDGELDKQLLKLLGSSILNDKLIALLESGLVDKELESQKLLDEKLEKVTLVFSAEELAKLSELREARKLRSLRELCELRKIQETLKSTSVKKMVAPLVDAKTECNILTKAAKELQGLGADIASLLQKGKEAGKNIMFEGAQGTMLDVYHGTIPYVTSSSTLAGAAFTGAGVGPGFIDGVVGVFKAYVTRVGGGPFPTECLDEKGDIDADGRHMANKGHEFGSVTGRARRCGWLDMNALNKTIQLNGVTALNLIKLDIFDGMDKLKICTHYELDGQAIYEMPDRQEDIARCKPVYKELPGWNHSGLTSQQIDSLMDEERELIKDQYSIAGITDLNKLPEEARNFIALVEKLANVPITLISTGAERDESIQLRKAFEMDHTVKQLLHQAVKPVNKQVLGLFAQNRDLDEDPSSENTNKMSI